MQTASLYVTADLPADADPSGAPFRRWRETIGSDDLVCVIVGETTVWLPPLLDALPGRKRLVGAALALDGGFLLSPLPLHPSQLAPGQINLHGRPLRPLPAAETHLCVAFDASGPLPLAEARAAVRRRGAAGLGLGLRLVGEPYAGLLWKDPA